MPLSGTALDEFLPLYATLAMPTRQRPGYSQQEVDAMDLAVVATLLRVELVDTQDYESQAQAMLRRRLEAARAGGPAPSW